MTIAVLPAAIRQRTFDCTLFVGSVEHDPGSPARADCDAIPGIRCITEASRESVSQLG